MKANTPSNKTVLTGSEIKQTSAMMLEAELQDAIRYWTSWAELRELSPEGINSIIQEVLLRELRRSGYTGTEVEGHLRPVLPINEDGYEMKEGLR